MKTILAPTDFSEAATNSVNYAAELANASGAKLLLLHAYHPPLITGDIPVVFPSMEEIAEASLKALQKIESGLRDKFQNTFPIKCIVSCGFAADETEKAAKENHSDLVVMGMRGAGIIEEKLIGSVTTSVMDRLKAPLLIVDSKLKYKKPDNIALATDFETISEETLTTIKYYSGLFGAKIHVVNVVSAEKLPAITEAVAGVKLDSYLQETDHRFATMESEDVVEGINAYIENNKIDMLVMMPRKHSLFSRLFSPSVTKKMAFHAHAPLLCIHE